MAIASPLIPSRPAPSYVLWATQTIGREYADAQVEAVNVQCMPRGGFRQLVSMTVRESLLTRVHLELWEIRSSLEVLQGGTLGARGGVLGWYTANTLQGHGQSTHYIPTWALKVHS